MAAAQSALAENEREESGTGRADCAAPGFDELAMPLLGSAHNLARWLVRNDHDAEDLVQETYLKACRNFHSFRPGTNFRAWMYRILRNTFLTQLSRRRASPIVYFDAEEQGLGLAIESETPESLLATHRDAQRMQRAIARLPVAYRQTLLLCQLEEMSYKQIAVTLAIPIGTVMSRLARARRLVRDQLGAPPGTVRRQPPGSARKMMRRARAASETNLKIG
jgi:RNA polymerase sigma-70 factor (ECF subfamily)